MLDNPLLMPPKDPFENQRALQDKIRAEAIELQRLCYEVFHMTDNGKKLYAIILKQFIMPAHFSPADNNAATLALYWEGFKTAMKGLHDNGELHAKRITQGGLR